ncbi:hypothetical protein I6F15_24030 [Bradyrhizobium sp. BRP14]|nr:hypothetical protein [Bradyrhizobium sp. BRP14]
MRDAAEYQLGCRPSSPAAAIPSYDNSLGAEYILLGRDHKQWTTALHQQSFDQASVDGERFGFCIHDREVMQAGLRPEHCEQLGIVETRALGRTGNTR